LRARIEELATQKPRCGDQRVHMLLRQGGWQVNRKRTYRLYRDAGKAARA
jgi:putative transposase